MFQFQTVGEVLAIATGKADNTYLRIKPKTSYAFSRAGEGPAPLSVEVKDNSLIKGLSLGTMITIEGEGAVGVHEWTKKEFGTVKSKDIQNYYFQAKKITVVKA